MRSVSLNTKFEEFCRLRKALKNTNIKKFLRLKKNSIEFFRTPNSENLRLKEKPVKIVDFDALKISDF